MKIHGQGLRYSPKHQGSGVVLLTEVVLLLELLVLVEVDGQTSAAELPLVELLESLPCSGLLVVHRASVEAVGSVVDEVDTVVVLLLELCTQVCTKHRTEYNVKLIKHFTLFGAVLARVAVGAGAVKVEGAVPHALLGVRARAVQAGVWWV